MAAETLNTGNEICLDEEAGIEVVSRIGKLLCLQNAGIAIAESCTGGLISHIITNVPGSSDYFLLSCVTYSNKAKINLLGVSPETIKRYGAVHEETAKEMAQGVRRIAGATYGLSTSGIAGPGGATDDKPVGTVCIGLAYVKGYRFNFAGNDRLTNKKIFAMKALDLLRTELLEQN
jgi:nicotinamide-nucleotide amidase